LPRRATMAKLLHADLVVPTAAFGSSECGVRNPFHGKKRVAAPVTCRSTVRARQRTGCRRCWMSIRRTARALA